MAGIGDLFDEFGNLRGGYPNDDEVDVHDPHPDIHELFLYYRDLYFDGQLPGVSVEWSSKRMTSCGGTCEKALNGAIIKLSQPLLILRPTRDLLMVLLHEMIHAYCMVNNIRDSDPTGHGPPFKAIMNKINTSVVHDHFRPNGGYNITIYHKMFAEVDYYKQHHWKCERCGDLIKRAMNRKPQEADCRLRIKSGSGQQCRDTRCKWHVHLKVCGGTYTKIKEPEGFADKNKKKKKKGNGGEAFTGQKHITGWLDPPSTTNGTLASFDAVLQHENHRRQVPPPQPTAEERRALLEAAALRRSGALLQGATGGVATTGTYPCTGNSKKKKSQVEVIDLVVEEEDEVVLPPSPVPTTATPPLKPCPPEASISCPICGLAFPANAHAALNSHLDECLAHN